MELLQTVKKENNMQKEGFFSIKIITVFVIGILIGFFGAWVLIRDKALVDNLDKTKDMETVVNKEDIGLPKENMVLARDQKAGLMVEIETVTLEKDSWIVIHESNNGALGNALGAQLFLKGASSGTVELLRGMNVGETYYAVVRQDDGDRAFDLSRDILLLNTKGEPVQVKFNATE